MNSTPNNPLNIRQMRPSDLDFAASLTALEGWEGETCQEFANFFEHDPSGCFVAELNGRKIGICIATPYQGFGFVGELIVLEPFRGQGFGRQMLECAIAYLQAHGATAIFLDGMPKAIPLYERLGFRKVCRSWRFSGHVSARVHTGVRPMHAADLEAVTALDRLAFGADRRFFLERRLALHPDLCKVLEAEGKIQGYIMGRRVGARIATGPWVAGPSAPRPADLLESLSCQIGEGSLSFGVLASNPAALESVESYKLVGKPDSPWRMVLGAPEHPGDPALIYAIGSPAKG